MNTEDPGGEVRLNERLGADTKPCPWCGTNAAVMVCPTETITDQPPRSFYIGCNTCDFWSGDSRSIERLIHRWNTRA